MESPFTDFPGTMPARMSREQTLYEGLEIKSPFIQADLNNLLQEPEVKLDRQIAASPVQTAVSYTHLTLPTKRIV